MTLFNWFNSNPYFTNLSNGQTICINENTTFVVDAAAYDPNWDSICFSISGGADAARFTINPSTGVLCFVTPPDFEGQNSAIGNDDIYDVTIRVADGRGGYCDVCLYVNVLDVPEPDGVVNGTGGDDHMGLGYTDPQCDKITEGSDSIAAGSGNDTVYAAGGNDSIDGGAGNDNLFGENGNDVVYGSDGNDSFLGGAGNDTVFGGNGDDQQWAGDAGDDLVYGGNGNDTISGDAGVDTLFGDAGNDAIEGHQGADLVYGGDGDDYIMGADLMYITNAADRTLTQQTLGFDDGAADTLFGGTGNDTAFGNSGHDQVSGDDGNDYVFGGAGNDIVSGGNGDDTVYGDGGTIATNPGVAGTAQIVINSQSGAYNGCLLVQVTTAAGVTTTHTLTNSYDTSIGCVYNLTFGIGDTIRVGITSPEGTFWSNTANAVVNQSNFEWARISFEDTANLGDQDFDDVCVDVTLGGNVNLLLPNGSALNPAPATQVEATGDDLMFGGAGNDLMYGDGGNDTILDGTGRDTVYGGAGNDFIDDASGFDSTADASLLYGDEGNDTMFGSSVNDTIFGGADSDSIGGESGDDLLNGGTGNDSIAGEGGNDQIFAGEGNDVSYGGSGNDYIEFGRGRDTVFGGAGNDVIDDVAGTSYADAGALIYGDAGQDLVWGTWVNDTIFGGSDADTLFGDSGADAINGGQGADQVYGGQGDDLLAVGGADSVHGGSGDDLLAMIFNEGEVDIAAVIDGGSDGTNGAGDGAENGNTGDVLDTSASSANQTVVLNTNAQSGSVNGLDSDAAADVTFANIEKVITGSGADLVTGGGNGGRANVDTGAGNDKVVHTFNPAAASVDTYNGGANIDTFALAFTAAQWAQPAVQTDVAAYVAHLAGGNFAVPFTFASTNVTVVNFEIFEVTVNGVTLDPANAGVSAGGDAISATEDGPASFAIDLLANDVVPDRAGNVQLLTATSAYGSLSLSTSLLTTVQTATLVFTPNNGLLQSLPAGQTLTEVLTYRVTDVDGSIGDATVTITITGTNDLATITGVASGTTTEDALAAISGDLNVADVDAGEAAFQTPANLSGTYGNFTFNPATGAWGYTPNAAALALQSLAVGQQVSDSLTVTSVDGTDSETITVTITGENDAPTLAASVLAAVEDGPSVTLNLAALGDDVDSDDDGSSLTYTIATAPSVGTASISGSTLTFAGGAGLDALALGETLTTTITVTATDAHGASTSNDVAVTITDTNDAPTLAASVLAAVEDGPSVTLNLAALGDDVDSDDDGSSLTYTIATAPSVGTASISGSTLTYDPSAEFQYLAAGETASVDIEVLATDAHGATTSNTITVTILGTNDAPVIVGAGPTSIVSDGFGGYTITGTVQFIDVDWSDTHAASASGVSNSGILVNDVAGNNAIGEMTWHIDATSNSGLLGTTQTITALVDDGNGGTASQSVTCIVPGVSNGLADVSSPIVVNSLVNDGQFGIDVNDYYTDPDLEPLTADADPMETYAGVIVDGSAFITLDPDSGAFQFLTTGQTYTSNFTFLVNDGTATQVANFEWTIEGLREGITGGAGADSLVGDDFDSEVIEGGAGDDTLTGGLGDDVFAYFAAGDGFDLITDFVAFEDHIGISASTFGGNLQAGTQATVLIDADYTLVNSGGTDGVFILQTDGVDGTLFWDADGGMGDNAVVLAQLTGVTSLTDTDFFVFI